MLRLLRRKIRYRVKKRTFVVLAISLLTTAAVALILALTAVWLAGPEDVLRVEIKESERRSPVLGAGVSLSLLPSDNVLQDASFEPIVYRAMFPVYEGGVQTLTLAEHASNPLLNTDNFFTGAAAQILSNGPDGLTLKKTALVAAYGVNRIGSFKRLQLPADLPDNWQAAAFADNGQVSLAVGAAGIVLRDLTADQPAVITLETHGNLTDVCRWGSGFATCSSDGELFVSEDGSAWQTWSVLAPEPLRAVAASEAGLVVAVGAGGRILTGSGGYLFAVASPVQTDLTDVVYGNGVFLALAADGTVLRSTSGSTWQILFQPAAGDPVYRTLACTDRSFALTGDQGLIAVSEDGSHFQPAAAAPGAEIRELLLLSARQMIVLGQDSRFCYTTDGGQTWTDSTTAPGIDCQKIARLADHSIISAGKAGEIGLAPLVTEVTLDQPLVSGQFAAGDLLFLEKTSLETPQPSAWEVLGTGDAERSQTFVPETGGRASLCLSAPSAAPADAVLTLSQSLDPVRLTHKNGSNIYTIELWLRQEGLTNPQVQVALSGGYQLISTTIDHVGTKWKKFTHAFVLPQGIISRTQPLRFNISFSGPGNLWIDQAFLGQVEADNPRGVASATSNQIRIIQPAALRLPSLPLGQAGLASFQWALDPGNDAPALLDGHAVNIPGQSLTSALHLAQAGHSDPWLTIDSFMSESEMLGLMEYLAGPITSTYGHLRMRQEEILPWSDSFNHIYLEITDTDNLFTTDSLRASYVDWLIQVVSRSPYYNSLKNKLVFVDGMTYSDGVWRSLADYHSSCLTGLYQGAGENGIQQAIRNYYDQLPRNPARPRQNWHELIAQASLQGFADQEPTLADLMVLELEELGNSAGLVNLSLNDPWSENYRQQDDVAARLAALTADCQLRQASSPASDLKAYAWQDTGGGSLVILANIGTEPKTVRLTGTIDTRDKTLTGYDQTGTLLRERTLRRSQEMITILPGGVAVLRGGAAG